MGRPKRRLRLRLYRNAFGGSAQFNVAWLTAQTHSVLAPAWYLLIGAAAGLVAMTWMRESAPNRLAR